MHPNTPAIPERFTVWDGDSTDHPTLDAYQHVEVLRRNGGLDRGSAGLFSWSKSPGGRDIVAYRLLTDDARDPKTVVGTGKVYLAEEKGPEYTGSSVSYYRVEVLNPTSGGKPYTAECNDIIEALGMNFAEGNAFKAVWRACAARMGKMKKGYTDGVYDAEKVEFFGHRMVVMAKAAEAGE